MKVAVMDLVPGLVGATIGGVVGYFAYEWGLRQGLVAGVVPGAFVGLGGGLLSARRSIARGVICGLGALGLGLFAVWKHLAVPESLGYFMSHLHELSLLMMIMIALGTFLGFRWGGDSLKPLPGKPKAGATSE